MGMTDREKAIQHFEDCIKIADCQINHNWVFVRTEILRDALILLKAQEPRVTCSVCKHSRCLSEEWFCFKIDSNRYGKRVADGDWYCKDAEGR